MWLFTTHAHLSIVAHQDRPGDLLVRARRAEDLTALFPGVPVVELPEADYRYRAVLPAETVAERVAEQVRAIDYGNFKDTVPDPERSAAYHDVWATMRRWGRTAEAQAPPRGNPEAAGGLDDIKRGARRFGQAVASEFLKGLRSNEPSARPSPPDTEGDDQER